MFKHMLRWVLPGIALIVGGCAQTQRPATPNEVLGDDLPRTALVIGNGDYLKITSLDNPSNDAGAIAAALRGAGYKVHRGGALTDLGRDEMQAVVDEFAAEIRQRGGIAFIYYAGHGIQVDGQNYLIPVDADIGSTADIRSETVDLQDLLKAVAATNVQMKVIVIDACRDNPFEAIAEAESGSRGDVQLAAANTDRNLRTLSSGLSQIIAPPGALVAFATAPGSVALDGVPGAKNSPYAEALVNVIGEPGLRVEDVFISVRNRVRTSTRGQQIPWETSSLTSVATFTGSYSQEDTGAPSVINEGRLTSAWDGRYRAFKVCSNIGGPETPHGGVFVDIVNGSGTARHLNDVDEVVDYKFYADGTVTGRGTHDWGPINYDGRVGTILSQGASLEGSRGRFQHCRVRMHRLQY